jgi:hypothetical protein
VIDTNVTRPEIEKVCQSIANSLLHLDERVRIGLITYASAVSLFELGQSGSTSCEVYDGADIAAKAEVSSLLLRQSRFVVPLKYCRQNIANALAFLVESAPLKYVAFSSGVAVASSSNHPTRHPNHPTRHPIIQLVIQIIDQ